MTSNHHNYQILAPSIHFLAFNLQESEIIKLKSNRHHISKDWLWKTCNNIVFKVLQQQFVITNYLDLTKEPNNFFVIIALPILMKYIRAGRDVRSTRNLLFKSVPHVIKNRYISSSKTFNAPLKSTNFYIPDAIPLQSKFAKIPDFSKKSGILARTLLTTN